MFPLLYCVVNGDNEDYCVVLSPVFRLYFVFQRQTVSLLPPPKIEEVLYKYKALHIETYGPLVPELEQLGRIGYVFIFFTYSITIKTLTQQYSMLGLRECHYLSPEGGAVKTFW